MKGTRTELKEYLGQTLNCECFVTNGLGFSGNKRLVTNVRIPGTKLYVKHVWVDEFDLSLRHFPHGYQKLDFKVVKYTNAEGQEKFGVEYAGKHYKRDTGIKKPKWML